jgi:hypothetical protein
MRKGANKTNQKKSKAVHSTAITEAPQNGSGFRMAYGERRLRRTISSASKTPSTELLAAVCCFIPKVFAEPSDVPTLYAGISQDE